MVGKKTAGDILLDSVVCFVLGVLFIATFYPFYYVLILSFNEGIDAGNGGIYFYPRAFTLDNYRSIFLDSSLLKAFFVSVLRTVVGTAAGVLLTSMVAYGLSSRKLMFKKLYFSMMVVSMYVSGGIIPFYIWLKQLHLLNTFWVYVLPGMLNTFLVLIMISFFREIPHELQESAHMDGANDLTIFYKIILPLSKPVIATSCLYIGVAQWNSWLDSAYFVQNPDLKTLSFKMMEIINKSMVSTAMGGISDQAMLGASMSATTVSLQMSTMMVAVTPILFVYPFLQKYFVKGFLIGSVKG
ncbi:carbohydrate ABC transporter permease [Paenibacillus eucommiae]|uniref:Aldouronate transport system permease protein n=1 Tax=Paenibacillus eucommiae TaxID=1355755 RepID=A0ABS4J4U4_9BACL|nr:carbohydrate ABC transporter permease [Paenibacillus eucommiae]MBP1993809.1 putative aldouronate transport system permease protein [Paenibacillus eucommiae]